ncbi:gamma carbonic anhydrase family protein [Chthonobacter albigriseus]|uniref:gamma carbonic anhydrase family protein n=1 Tax=Chthonobacter albigriseus TaxID=1683161 RepID=UPI0015EEE55F|nr:gamma carbonic anhydrase family protein [Chthonobacter albigriseus]
MPLYSLEGIAPTVPAAGTWWMAPDASVMGKVVLGEGVGLWFGAVLRGDNELIAIGANTNIQEHAMLHTDPGFPLTVGEGCTIGHRAILHGCTIGNNSLIGMGATVLNGAVIGNNCLVGANALVTEGKAIPDDSLVVGAPAKVIRSLDEAAIARLKVSAANYVRNWKRYAAHLVLLPQD